MFAASPLLQTAILVGTLNLVPAAPPVCDEVDLVVLNHVYDAHGRLVLHQIIFWDWNAAAARYQVVAWRLWKDERLSPQRDWLGGGYVLLWHDDDVLRRVRASSRLETWTQHDREIADRQRLPQSRRRGLTPEISPRISAHHRQRR